MRGMGSSGELFVTLLVGVVAVNAAKVFKVGGYGGWIEPAEGNYTLYKDRASSHQFHIGNSLSNRPNPHLVTAMVISHGCAGVDVSLMEGSWGLVMVVDKWSFYHCSVANLIAEFTNGNSTFVLDRPGPFYFISGANNHCKNGQRLLVEVIHPKSHPAFAKPPEGGYHFAPASSSTSAAPALRSQGLTLSAVFGAFGVLRMCWFVVFS